MRRVLVLVSASLLVALVASPVARQAAGDIPYRTGAWDAETLGNHRVVLRVAAAADAVRVRIPWRRRDLEPERKHLVVTDPNGVRVANVVRREINREFGDLAFQPIGGAGEYSVYYLPNSGEGRANYPRVTYPEPIDTTAASWLERNGLPDGFARLPEAAVVAFESVDELTSFFPMEVIATRAETDALVARHPGASYLLFPEDRRYPIRMAADLPRRWIERGAGQPVAGTALRGEWYAFQIGVYAATRDVTSLDVTFGALAGPGGATIPASAARCVNLGGVDWTGRPFRKTVRVARGAVQAIWCGIEVPEDATPGRYTSAVTVSPEGAPATALDLALEVVPDVIADHGDNEPWRHSRLRWLDSTIALDDEVVAPYTPVTREGSTIGVLGRTVTLDALGFPRSIRSRFAIEMTRLGETARELLAAPVALVVEGRDGRRWPWRAGDVRFTTEAPGVVAWESGARTGPLTLTTRARMEFDGMVTFEVRLAAREAADLGDVRLEIPMAAPVARFMMGMGLKGGARPASYDWSWQVSRNQDSAWIGDVNAGLQVSLRDERYSRPLNTNFYRLKPLVMPRSWSNDGRGGCRFRERGETFLVSCFSGARRMAAGEELAYDFSLLLTPFHTLDTDAQWRTRFLHDYRPIPAALDTGASVINVHHARDINPYINYPFLRPLEMKAYADEAHANGLKMKIYYTVRELTNRAPEIFALLSLGDEIFQDGPGGGPSWLQEHVGSGYIAGWYVPALKDAALVNSGVSRWHNYYLEGLAWLTRHVGIDGLYIDDVAFDRTVMKRVRKILDRGRPGALIDLHSANQYNARDGFASSANLYLEHFPYLDRLWFGEYFDYNFPPDFWLVEVSGIPFGLMGEMLEGGGNPWRGMLYGMTNRLPWGGTADPRPIWRAWDEFGMAGSRMVGYWVPDRPIRTGDDRVPATTYLQPGRALVAMASWADETVTITPAIDWAALGLDPARAVLEARPIDGFQPARTFRPGETIPVEPGRGWLLLVR